MGACQAHPGPVPFEAPDVGYNENGQHPGILTSDAETEASAPASVASSFYEKADHGTPSAGSVTGASVPHVRRVEAWHDVPVVGGCGDFGGERAIARLPYLPASLVAEVLSFLRASDLAAVACTCKALADESVMEEAGVAAAAAMGLLPQEHSRAGGASTTTGGAGGPGAAAPVHAYPPLLHSKSMRALGGAADDEATSSGSARLRRVRSDGFPQGMRRVSVGLGRGDASWPRLLAFAERAAEAREQRAGRVPLPRDPAVEVADPDAWCVDPVVHALWAMHGCRCRCHHSRGGSVASGKFHSLIAIATTSRSARLPGCRCCDAREYSSETGAGSVYHRVAVFACGAGRHGRLGTGSEDGTAEPTCVAALTHSVQWKDGGSTGSTGDAVGAGPLAGVSGSDKLVALVAAGAKHSLVVTRGGELLTFGSGKYGQLGTGDANDCMLPTAVHLPGDEGGSTGEAGAAVKVVDAAGGLHHSVIADAKGRAFATGRGSSGQLGCGDRAGRLRLSAMELPPRTRITSVSAGDAHTLLLAADGAVLSCGAGACGCLGHGDDRDRLRPTRIAALVEARARVVSISAGGAHSACVTDGGAVLTWGSGGRGCLGHGSVDDELRPRRVMSLPAGASLAGGGVAGPAGARRDRRSCGCCKCRHSRRVRTVLARLHYLGVGGGAAERAAVLADMAPVPPFRGHFVRECLCALVRVCDAAGSAASLGRLPWAVPQRDGSDDGLGDAASEAAAAAAPAVEQVTGETASRACGGGALELGRGAAAAESVGATAAAGIVNGRTGGRAFVGGDASDLQMQAAIAASMGVRAGARAGAGGGGAAVRDPTRELLSGGGGGRADLSGGVAPEPCASVECGDSFTAVVTRGGRVWAWGNGRHGRLGIGSDASVPLPVLVVDASGAAAGAAPAQLSADAHALLCSRDGRVLTWGFGFGGSLGHACFCDQYVPRQLRDGALSLRADAVAQLEVVTGGAASD